MASTFQVAFPTMMANSAKQAQSTVLSQIMNGLHTARRQGNQRITMTGPALSFQRILLILSILCFVTDARSALSAARGVSVGSRRVDTAFTRGGIKPPHTISHLKDVLFVRGGSDDEDEDDDSDYEDSDDFDDEEEFFDDFEMGDAADDDFAEDNLVERMIQGFHKTPPLTKGYLTASFAVTAAAYVLNKNNFPELLVLDWKKVLTRGQLWRPFTTFFNFGPFGLGYLMTMHFVWTYMSTLERLHHHKPYDFWIMIVFGMLSMVVGYPIMNVNARFLGHNLSTFLVYVWSRYHEGLEVNMFELFNTRAELLPWFFLAQTFLLEGEPPILDFLGIVFGHVYHHCKTVGLLRAPDGVVSWYKKSNSPYVVAIREKYKEISSDFEMI